MRYNVSGSCDQLTIGLICNFNNVCVQQYFNAFVYVPRTTKVQCKKVSQNKLIKVQQESKMSLFYSNSLYFFIYNVL